MRRALLLVTVVAACDQGVKKEAVAEPGSGAGSGSAVTSGPIGVSTVKFVPPGPYVVRYDCFHSDQPFGPGNQVRNQSFDLGTKLHTLVEYQYSGEPPANGPDDASVHAPVVSPLSDPRVAMLERAAIAVLRGGPFKPEYPVPEGTPCELAISAGGTEVFKLEKAGTQEKDAASDLVNAMFAF